MEQQYVWNITEVVKNNPIPEGRKLTRTFLVDGKYCTALVVQAQPQEEPFIHIHKEHDEFLYVLEGEGWAYIGDKKLEVKAGDLVYCPVGMEHGFFMPVKGVRLSIYGHRLTANILIGLCPVAKIWHRMSVIEGLLDNGGLCQGKQGVSR